MFDGIGLGGNKMKKLEGLWIDEGNPISDSERLLKLDLNQRMTANKVDELVAAFNKLKKEWDRWNE